MILHYVLISLVIRRKDRCIFWFVSRVPENQRLHPQCTDAHNGILINRERANENTSESVLQASIFLSMMAGALYVLFCQSGASMEL